MSTETGHYKLICYDGYGRTDKRFSGCTDTLTEAVTKGEAMISAGDIESFTVDRRIFNSLDVRRQRWDVK